jgi:hypothetical protein
MVTAPYFSVNEFENPYFSVNEFEKPADERRFHDNTECGPGSRISETNKRYGTAKGGKRCEICATLEPGQSIVSKQTPTNL